MQLEATTPLLRQSIVVLWPYGFAIVRRICSSTLGGGTNFFYELDRSQLLPARPSRVRTDHWISSGCGAATLKMVHTTG
jgi:hypothetical protein